MDTYKLLKNGSVRKNGVGTIQSPTDFDPASRGWRKYQAWLLIPGNVPDPADPLPVPDIPEPTVSELIEALEAKDSGDNSKWDNVKRRKKIKKGNP